MPSPAEMGLTMYCWPAWAPSLPQVTSRSYCAGSTQHSKLKSPSGTGGSIIPGKRSCPTVRSVWQKASLFQRVRRRPGSRPMRWYGCRPLYAALCRHFSSPSVRLRQRIAVQLLSVGLHSASGAEASPTSSTWKPMARNAAM